MNHFKTILIVLAASIAFYQARAATFELDFRGIDNASARVYGPGVDLVFLTSSLTTVTFASAATFYVEIDYNSQISAKIKMDVANKGAISNVSWMDADSSQTSSQYVPLPTDYYTISNGGKRLVPIGIPAEIDFKEADLAEFNFPQAGVPAPNGTTGKYEYSLFPGDYKLITGKDTAGEGNAILDLELLAGSDSWSNTIYWTPYEADTTVQAVALPDTFYSIDTSEIAFLGKQLTFSIDVDNEVLTLLQAGEEVEDNDLLKLFPGNYTLRSGNGDSLSAHFRLLLDAVSNEFKDSIVVVDSDSTLFGSGRIVASDIIYEENDTLFVIGQPVYLNLERPDINLRLKNTASGVAQTGWQLLKLLPGDYWYGIAGSDARIASEVREDGSWNGRVYYLPGGEQATLQNLLHGRLFTRNPDSLDIHGMPVSFHVAAISDGLDFKVLGLEDGKGEIPDSAILNLLPGDFILNVKSDPSTDPFMDVAFEFDNRKGGLSSRVDWNDLAEGSTGGQFEQYPAEDILAKHGALVIFYVPGGPKTYFRQDYAVPERSPSGSWYQLADAELWFKYEGEYQPGWLQANVMNWNRDIVLSSSSLSLPKEYGDNRLMIDCSTLGAGHYTLELVNEKNETFYVRFEKN